MSKNNPQPVHKDDKAPTVYQQASLTYSAPLPPPAILKGYGDIDPSFPERVFSDFEKNSQHVRDQERTALKMQARDTKTGQWMAFAVIMTGLIGTMVLAYLGKDYAAIATAVGTAVMIFKGAFTTGKSKT